VSNKGFSRQKLANHSEYIPIFRSNLPRPEYWLKYLEPAYETSKFSNFGEASHELERRVADFLQIDSSTVVTCVNATQALTGAVSTAEKNDYEWTIPSWTFTATASAMFSANKSFYFSDIDDEWRIKPSNRNVNLIDVLPFGAGIDTNRFEVLCDGEIVIDAAASFDALRYSKISELKKRFGLVISFHPTKFPAGPEGAVFISNDHSWVEKFRLWTIFGMDEKRTSFFPGTNAKMNEFSAAVILASLDKYFPDRDSLIQSSKRALDLSHEFGFDVNESIQNSFASPYWIVKKSNEQIGIIEEIFQSDLIATRRWWMYGCHAMEAYKEIKKSNLSKTSEAANSSIGLPMFIGMSEEHWGRIEKAFRKIASK